MTQLSTDYIDWMMDPQRKRFRRRLNDEWKPEGGDWFIHTETGLVKCLLMDEGAKLVYVDKGALQWLPDLGQLLGMIQAFGYKVSIWQDEYTYCADAWKPTSEERARHEGGWKVAAASLLAKLWGVE